MNHHKRPSLAQDDGIPGKNDYPLIRSQLIKASSTRDFEEAKGEWELEARLTEEDLDFSDRCELCNHVLQVLNYRIWNPRTNKRLRIGRECVKRFNFKGITNDEDKETFLNRLDRKDHAVRRMRRLLCDVLPDCRKYQHVMRFRSLAFQWLETRRQEDVPPEKWLELLDVLGLTDKGDCQLISSMLWGQVPMQREVLRKTGTEDGSWGPRKRTRARVLISPSRLDRPDHAVE